MRTRRLRLIGLACLILSAPVAAAEKETTQYSAILLAGRKIGHAVETIRTAGGKVTTTQTQVMTITRMDTPFTIRMEQGRPGVPDEKLRLLWIQNRIQFNNPLVEMLEKEYQANTVSDELNDIYWDPLDPDDPYTGMARRAISIPLNGGIQGRIKHLQKLARNYKLDGAINPCNWGCRQGSGARGLISDGLKEIGLPVLNLEVDCVDKRNFAEGQLRTRLEAFVEMLESRQ